MDPNGQNGRYALKQVVGRGAYGVVYRAVNRGTKEVCAIKQIQYDDESELNAHMLEIDLLKNLRHENIVEYQGFIQKSHELYILLEYCGRGSLRDIIKKGPLVEIICVDYIRQTLKGLQYLHDQGVIHRDIKAANLLLTEEGVVKLADFGVSTRINRMAMTYAGSPNWMAPEVMTGQGASTVSDIWSLGATVVELLTGNPPFHNLVNESACYAIVNEEYIPPLTLSIQCQKFLSRCFQKNMFRRASAEELLRHEWLQEDSSKSHINLAEYVEKDTTWDEDFVLDSNTEMAPSPTKSISRPHLRQTDFKNITADQMFGTFSLDEIAMQLLIFLQSIKQTKSQKNEKTFEILRYDKRFNHSKLKKRLVDIGGLSTMVNLQMEAILCAYFDSEFPLLLQCGISSHFENFKNSRLIVLIAYSYRSVVSRDTWNQWCLEYNEKLATSIESELVGMKPMEAEKLLIFVSQVPDFTFNISKLMRLVKEHDYLQQCTFISFNHLLRGSVSSAPASNLLHGKLFYEKSNFPESVIQWLLEMIPLVKEKTMEQFVELCFHLCHLNNSSISQLMKHGQFLELTRSLLQSKDKVCIPWCLSLCTEVVKDLNENNLPSMFEIGISSLTESNCLSSSIEIILNCFNVAQQLDLPIIIEQQFVTIKDRKIPLHLLVSTFYQDNGRYDKFLTKYTKLCSISVGKYLCEQILKDDRFIGRIHELFGRFKTSLIIQIDILKFLKILAIQLTNEQKQAHSDKLTHLSQFLIHNWDSNVKNFTPIKQAHQRVGADSILIQQLCTDIRKLI